jgi:hypothetical protein
LKTAIIAICTLGLVSAEKAGLAIGIDHEFVNYVTDTIGPEIVDAINTIQIANTTWKGGYVKNVTIALDEGNLADFMVDFDTKQ